MPDESDMKVDDNDSAEQSDDNASAPEPPKPVDSGGESGQNRLAELERFRGEIQREIEHSRNASSREIAELREALKEAKEYIEEQKKALREHDKPSNESTIVVPPDQVARPQREEEKPADDSNAETAGAGKRRGLRSWY